MITYRDVRPEDGAPLAAMAQDSFVETFGHLYRPPDLAAFLDRAFGPDGLLADVSDPQLRICVALGDDQIIGFAKMAPRSGLPSPACTSDSELKQLYVLKPWQGAGIAATLIEWAIATARRWAARRLVLSVYADNHRAKRFYARYGFHEIGFAPFPVGEHIDDDRIWSLDL